MSLPTQATTNSKAPLNGARLPDEPLGKVQPPRREDLPPSYAQVIKPGERLTLTRLVDVMVLHNLRFYQEKNEDGQLSFRLDP